MFTENYIFVCYYARFTCSLYFHQVDQPKGVLPRQMYINNTGQYDKYFNAYKDLTIGLAKLLIRENNGNVSANDSYLNLAFENMLKLETKIAKVVLVLLVVNHNSEYITIRECKSSVKIAFQMSSPAEDRRNETKMYNPFTLKDLNEKYPNVISLHIVQSNNSCQII